MKKKCILLVEDDSALRCLLRESLDGEYEVLEASKYSEIIAHAGKHIDLAVIDYSLPGKNGFEILKMLREKSPSLPVIIMTAYSSEDLAIEAVRADVNDYIKKPFYFEHLKMRIAEIFWGKKSFEHFESPANRDESIIEGLAMYMKNNYMKDITRAGLAEMGSMERHKLSRMFKNTTGQSLSSYLNSVRLEKAAELLKNSDLTIKEIVCFVGFKNIEHFNRLFRILYCTSPKDFRKKT